MYGKAFESMYEGSMVGAGSHVFAVWNYVIAKQKPDRVVGSQVRLNPELLATIIGDTRERMQEAIDFLCAPDSRTTTPGREGRRLIQIGTFDYQVVNGAHYRSIRNEEERRAQNRIAQARYRARQKQKQVGDVPLANETAAVEAEQRGDTESYDRLSAETTVQAEP